MKKLPRAKNDNVVVQQLDKELLIYDLITNQAFCLNQTSAVVFNACDGETTFEELKSTHKFTNDLIFLALDELKKESLLADDNYQSPFAGMSRREVVKKVGLATMVALPFIVGVAAPVAAAAASCVPLASACVYDNGKQSDCCNGLRCDGFPGCINCLPTGFSVPVLIGDIPLFTNYCCGGAATTTPLDATRVAFTCN